MATTNNTASYPLRLLQKALRLLPAETRGKGRLTRCLLTRHIRSRSVLTEDMDGNIMMLPNLLEPVGLYLWMDGVYEPDVLKFLRDSITPGSVAIDVGANIGAFTVPLARHLTDGGRVIAIEASPAVAQILKLNVAHNQLTNVTVIECAASSGELDRIPFYEAPEDHFGMGSSAPQFGARALEIHARSLDKIVSELGAAAISVIKVDVEGYEAHVFQGAQNLLHSRCRPHIVFEFCDWAEERAFPGRRGWAQEILFECGYALWRLSDFQSGRDRLKTPVREGFDSLVAIPLSG